MTGAGETAPFGGLCLGSRERASPVRGLRSGARGRKGGLRWDPQGLDLSQGVWWLLTGTGAWRFLPRPRSRLHAGLFAIPGASSGGSRSVSPELTPVQEGTGGIRGSCLPSA